MFRPVLTSVLLGLSMLGGGCFPAALSVSGKLPPGTTRWQGEVHIVGDVEIPAGAEVVMAPGTQVVFMPGGPLDRLRDHPHFVGSELIVHGRLVARGSSEEPIVFRYIDPSGEAGSWGGINLMESPRAEFAFCLFRQADSAIHSQQSQVTIRESIFEDNLVGIRFNSSSMLIEHNLLRRNGAGIRFHFGAPIIRNNLLTRNRKGLFITAEPRDYQVYDNVFVANEPYDVVLGEGVGTAVDLSGNWWGAQGFQQERVFDARRDPDLGRVVALPVLHESPSAGVSWSR